jgi:hypothetical protein
MAEESVEVLVLRDADGNLYALPRRIVERARVPKELGDLLPLFRHSGRRYWPTAQSTRSPFGAVTEIEGPPIPMARSTDPRLPWPVGWVRVP